MTVSLPLPSTPMKHIVQGLVLFSFLYPQNKGTKKKQFIFNVMNHNCPGHEQSRIRSKILSSRY